MERFPFKFPDENAYWKLDDWESKRVLAFEIIREAEEIEQLMVGKGEPEKRGRAGGGVRRGAGSGRHH